MCKICLLPAGSEYSIIALLQKSNCGSGRFALMSDYSIWVDASADIDRKYWMFADQALEYGLIDEIIG